MSSALVVFGVFLAVLAWVSYLKVRGAVRMLRWIGDSPSRLLKRATALAAIPAVIASVVLMARGFAVPGAVAVGALLLLGTVLAGAGVLGLDGALIESGSDAQLRVARGELPPTSAVGRAVALTLGVLLAGSASALVWWVVRA